MLRLKLIAASMFFHGCAYPNRHCNVALSPTPDRIIESMSTGRTNGEYDKLPSWHNRAGIATLTGRESGLESAANRTSITARIGGSSPPGIGTGSVPADGKAAPHTGAARPKPTAKRKTLRTPRQPERLPDLSPAPGSLALATQKRCQLILRSVVRIRGYCFSWWPGSGFADERSRSWGSRFYLRRTVPARCAAVARRHAKPD